MGKVWVLDTATKGTGANVVPLESVQTKRSASPEPVFVPRKPRARPEEAPAARVPRRFKVVDVMTNQALVDGASTRETVDALKRVRSVVDIIVYVWLPEDERWRMLTLAEQRSLWQFAVSD
jgi:hypothetical protein